MKSNKSDKIYLPKSAELQNLKAEKAVKDNLGQYYPNHVMDINYPRRW